MAPFSLPIMPYPILNCILNFKGISQYLHNREQIQTCIVFMLKQPPGGHFKFPISVKLHPYGMSSNVATFSLNMKTIGLTHSVVTVVIKGQMCHFYIEK